MRYSKTLPTILVTLAILFSSNLGNGVVAAPLSSGAQRLHVLRDDPGRVFDPTKIRIGTVILPSTVRQNLKMLLLKTIASDASDRFVTASPISATSFGGSDPVHSNSDLRDEVDHVFTADDDQAGNLGWVDAYINFLLDAGEPEQSVTEQNKIIDDYSNAVIALAERQMKLLQVFQDVDDDDTEVTNIGSDIKDSEVPKLDALTMRKVENWAQSSGISSKKVSKDDWDSYIAANKTAQSLQPEYDDLTDAIAVTAQGYFFKKLINSYPGAFNLSMLIGGQPSSPQAQFAPAWTATVINTTLILGDDALEIQRNLDGNLHDSTFTDSTEPTGSIGLVPSQSSIPHLSSSSSSPSQTPSEPGHARRQSSISARNGIQITGNYSLQASHPIKARNGIYVVGNSSLPTKRADTAPAEPLNNDSGVQVVGNNTDPLGDVPDIPLQGNLMILSLTEGTWSDKRDEYIRYAFRERPDVFKKYFCGDGVTSGACGRGPIGRHWTHIVLITLNKVNSTELATVQILGKVFDVLPVLKSNDLALGVGTHNFSHTSITSTASATSIHSSAPTGTLAVLERRNPFL